MRRALVLFLLVAAGSLVGCAGQECDFNSQCGEGFYCEFGNCRQDCRNDLDCEDALVCSPIGQCVIGTDAGPRPDAGPGEPDAGPDIGVDAGPGPPDAGPPDQDAGPPDQDAGPPTPDAGPPLGTGAYLDRCNSGSDCASGRCVDDIGGTRMCTIACTGHRDCVGEHVCGPAGECVRDDTGATCSLGSPATCALGLCFGNTVAGVGHCTRDCANAADCPGGYACVDAGMGTRVCADIERPCTAATDCGTGICIPGLGCTSQCTSAADCPQRFGFLTPYTCGIAHGSTVPICVPPSDIRGPDAIGTPCSIFGDATCRAGPLVCDSTPLGNFCTQSCTEEGGCAEGLGCFPSVEDLGAGLEIVPLCSRAGTRPVGATCANGRECASSMCDSVDLFCTRLCTDDGICPTGYTCRPIPGFGRSVCRR